MQCSNCQFENMPGIQICGRCGTSLQLGASTIDVHPPRASRAAKRWRRWLPVTRYWNRLRSASSLSAIQIVGWPQETQTLGLLLRMIVPGWAQRHLGRRFYANVLFACFLTLLLTGVAFLGTPWGWLLLGLAISVHALSVLDIVATTTRGFRQRLIYSAVALFVLITLVYNPARLLLDEVASPQYFAMAAPPFQVGDVVLVNRQAYRYSDPQPGDVVFYALPEGETRWQNGRPLTIYRTRGDRVDRILARGGQRVVCRAGELLIDAKPTTLRPLNPQRMPEGFEITVPEGCYLVFPSTDAVSNTFPLPVWQAASIIPRSHIVGRVYLHTHPLSRFGRIR